MIWGIDDDNIENLNGQKNSKPIKNGNITLEINL